ncbi:response regulator transcription factor [Vallitalea okinawensis]|uniref:response regulator transcription factor n=1 Tax=Vallitalea okinawensis TaxID=2078660 RepID=UPI000CFDA70B|nr:response regulator transcription factor [Vallitalea okinawensis]
MKKTILYAEDDQRYRDIVKAFLLKNDYKVTIAKNGLEALALFADNPNFDMVILDVMMPEMDGFETCNEIRKTSDVPIMMLTALGDDINEIKGMNIGADDYISKPFSYPLFLAHINAMLRRKKKDEKQILSLLGMELDENRRSVEIDGEKLNLTPREFNLLLYLVKNKGQALSREQILDRVWGYEYDGDKRTVDTHIKSLRAALGELGNRIKTIYRYGYCFEEDGLDEID